MYTGYRVFVICLDVVRQLLHVLKKWRDRCSHQPSWEHHCCRCRFSSRSSQSSETCRKSSWAYSQIKGNITNPRVLFHTGDILTIISNYDSKNWKTKVHSQRQDCHCGHSLWCLRVCCCPLRYKAQGNKDTGADYPEGSQVCVFLC